MKTRSTWIVAFALLVAGIIYLAASDAYIGAGYDNAVYVGLAQGLAQGKGFVQMPVPGHPPEPQYPPGWSLLLSVVWLIAPEFPANAFGFKIMSVVCALVFAALVYGWMRWRGENPIASALIVGLTLFNPLTFGSATFAFSEMAYAANSILALWLIERYTRAEHATWRGAMLPALAAAGTVYIRAFGMTLGIAALIYFATTRQARKFIAFGGLVALVIAPWFLRGALLPQDVWSYSQQFFLKSMEQPELGTIGWGDLVLRVIFNLRAYLLAGLPGALLPSQVPLTYANLAEDLRVGAPIFGFDILLALIIATALLGQIVLRRALADWYIAAYLGLALVWQWEPTRFVIPLIPLLYGVVWTTIKPGARLFSARAPRGLMIALVGAFILVNAGVMARLAWQSHQSESPERAARLRAFEWIRAHTAETSVLAALDDYQVYLYTRRPVIRALGSADALAHYQVEYVILIPYGGVMVEGDLSRLRFEPLRRAHPDAFARVYADESAGIQIYRVLANR